MATSAEEEYIIGAPQILRFSLGLQRRASRMIRSWRGRRRASTSFIEMRRFKGEPNEEARTPGAARVCDSVVERNQSGWAKRHDRIVLLSIGELNFTRKQGARIRAVMSALAEHYFCA